MAAGKGHDGSYGTDGSTTTQRVRNGQDEQDNKGKERTALIIEAIPGSAAGSPEYDLRWSQDNGQGILLVADGGG